MKKIREKVWGWVERLIPVTFTLYQGHLTRKLLRKESRCLLCGERVKGIYSPSPLDKQIVNCPKMLQDEEFVPFALKHPNSRILLVVDKRTTDEDMVEVYYTGFIALDIEGRVRKSFFVFDKKLLNERKERDEREQEELIAWLLG